MDRRTATSDGPTANLDRAALQDAVTIALADPIDGHTPEIITSGLHLAEAERVHDLSWAALESVLAAGDEPAVQTLRDVLQDWVRARPVTDREALNRGVAVLRWEGYGEPAWQVNVLRPSGTLVSWVPTLRTPRPLVTRVRAAALTRAAAEPVRAHRHGDLTALLHASNDRLGAGMLLHPEWVAQTAGAGLHLVVPPGDRPVLIGTPAAAARFAATVSETVHRGPLTTNKPITWAP